MVSGFRLLDLNSATMEALLPIDIPEGSISTTVDDIKSSITLRILNYGNYGIFLIMGSAGFISSTVPLWK